MVKNAGPALVIQAGTATSMRLRDGESAELQPDRDPPQRRVEVQVIAWDGSAFHAGNRAAYAFDGENWQAAAGRQRRVEPST